MKEITDDVKEIQKIALGILVYVDKVCRENNIKYTLDAGTLLGAVRHKGFIPWDDDIDISMPRDEYDRFIEIMEKDNNSKYKILYYGDSYPNYSYRYAKVVDLDTMLIESTLKMNKDMGVFIDVFAFDGAPKNCAKTYKKARFYAFMAQCANYTKISKKDNTLKKYIAKKICKPIAKITGGYKHWLNKYEKYVRRFDINKYEYLIAYSGYSGTKNLTTKEYYNHRVELEFEGHKFFALENYDKYLTDLYGDYMKLPPIEQQVTHHQFKAYKKVD